MRVSATLLASLLLALSAPAAAWKGDVALGVRTIAEVTTRAEEGDHVVVEGEITDVRTGSGSRHVATLEDASGSVFVRVPEHLLRALNEGRDPEVGRRVRAGGKWGHAAMDDETIHAQTAERL